MTGISMYELNYDTARLSNGLTVATRHLDVPDVVVRIQVQEGKIHEPPHMEGIWKLIETLLYREGGAIDRIEEATGRDVRRPYSDHEKLIVSSMMPADSLEEYVSVVGGLLKKASYDEATVSYDRDRIINQFKAAMGNPAAALGARVMRDHHYPGHVLGRYAFGYPETMEQLTSLDIANYKSERLNSANTIVTVVGGFDRSTLIDSLEKHLGDLPQGIARPTILPGIPAIAPIDEVLKSAAAFITTFNMQFQVPGKADPDNYSYRLMMDYLCDGMSSPMMKSIRIDRGLAYAVGCDTGDKLLNTGIGTITVQRFDIGKLGTIRELMDAEIDKLKQGIVDKDRLATLKSAYVDTYWQENYETVWKQAYGVASIASGLNPHNPGDIPRMVEAFGPDDLARIAQKVFNGNYVYLTLQP